MSKSYQQTNQFKVLEPYTRILHTKPYTKHTEPQKFLEYLDKLTITLKNYRAEKKVMLDNANITAM